MSSNPREGMGSEAFEGGRQGMESSVGGAQEGARRVAEAVMGGRGTELREEIGRIGSAAKGAAYEHMEHLRQAGLDKAHQLEGRIQEQPLKSVLIAAGIGFLLGVLWMRD